MHDWKKLEIEERVYKKAIEYISPFYFDTDQIDFESFCNDSIKYDVKTTTSLKHILFNSDWVTLDIEKMGHGLDSSDLGDEFGKKYGDRLSFKDDARSVCRDWFNEAGSIAKLIHQEQPSSKLLHVGCDNIMEADVFHQYFNDITIVDIAREQLSLAKQASPYANAVQDDVNYLNNIESNSMGVFLALRVCSSFGVNKELFISSVYRILNENATAIISIPNGYKAIDGTIIPGQIIGSNTPTICLIEPFRELVKLLNASFSSGFSGAEVTFGECEIYLVLQKRNKRTQFKLDISDFSHIPLNFYSELLPTSWLGNFYKSPQTIEGKKYATPEHYFQSQKFINHPEIMKKICNCGEPIEAKELAWTYSHLVRKDWAINRLKIMHKMVYHKFSIDQKLRKNLLLTNQREIVESSEIDKFWGRDSSGTGLNYMGKILMEVRKQL